MAADMAGLSRVLGPTSLCRDPVPYPIQKYLFCEPLWSHPETGLFVQYLNTGKVPGAKTLADVRAHYEAQVPMNRGCDGKDVIRAILYAVEQKYETGQAIPVTGGQVMLN